MRFGVVCIFVAACGFDAKLSPDDTATDATKSPDASTSIDAAPDAPAKVCAAAYVAVPGAQTQSKYRRVQDQTRWLVAKADCESDGGHMIVAETIVEAKAIHAFI